ncbi:hypothetical protein K1X76_12140, partial [bacterium]|nr:hypothetical protein [bacterium]
KDLGKTSMDEVKKEITDMLTKMKEREFRQDYAKDVLEHLAKKNKVDVPEGLLNREVEESKKNKEDVEKSLKTDFILEAIAKKENIKVDPKDLEARFQQLSMMYRMPVAQIKEHYRNNNLIGQLVFQLGLEKTLDFIIDKAKMV